MIVQIIGGQNDKCCHPDHHCDKCGYPTCLAFGVALVRGEAKLKQCPVMSHGEKVRLGKILKGINKESK